MLTWISPLVVPLYLPIHCPFIPSARLITSPPKRESMKSTQSTTYVPEYSERIKPFVSIRNRRWGSYWLAIRRRRCTDVRRKGTVWTIYSDRTRAGFPGAECLHRERAKHERRSSFRGDFFFLNKGRSERDGVQRGFEEADDGGELGRRKPIDQFVGAPFGVGQGSSFPIFLHVLSRYASQSCSDVRA